MPDHADPVIAADSGCLDGTAHGLVHRMILMVAGKNLIGVLPVTLEQDKMAQQIHQRCRRKHPAQQDFNLRHRGWSQFPAIHSTPGHETLLIRGERARAGIHAITGNHDCIVGKKRRNLVLVGLQLIVGIRDIHNFIRHILQLDDHQRQAIDKDNHIGTFLDAILNHGKLIHCQEIVELRVLEIKDLHFFRMKTAIALPDRHINALGQQFVKDVIVAQKLRVLRYGNLPIRLSQSRFRQIRIKLRQRILQSVWQKHVRIRCPLRTVPFRRCICPESNFIAQLIQPLQHRFFQIRLNKILAHFLIFSP